MTYMGSVFGVKCYVATAAEWASFLKLHAMAAQGDSAVVGVAEDDAGAVIVAPGKWRQWITESRAGRGEPPVAVVP